MLTLDTTISGVNANSYATIATIDGILIADPGATAWFALGAEGVESEAKKGLAIKGTWVLDTYMDYHGYPTTDTQNLQFPRQGCYDRKRMRYVSSQLPEWVSYLDPNTIPKELVHALAMLCKHMAESDRLIADPKAELASSGIGALQKSYFKSGWKHQIIPDDVFYIINFLGQRVNSKSIELRRG